MRAAVVGSVNLDLVWRTADLPLPGQTVQGRGFAQHFGGKGANQAVACAKMGAETWFVGRVGAEPYGSLLRRGLCDAGVHVEHLAQDHAASSGTAGIVVADSGQNQIVLSSGANGCVTGREVEEALALIRPDFVLAQNEISLEATLAAARHGGRLIFNPAPSVRFPNEIWERTWLAAPNETEAEDITGTSPVDDASCEAACRWLLDRGVRHVILTLGAKGAWVSGAGLAPGFAVEPVDATAAGDCFIGSLASCLVQGMDLGEAVRWAMAAAALSVTREGAQDSMPARAEVESFLAS